MRTKLLLIDDHPMLCNGFKQFVLSRPDLELVGEASTAAEGLKRTEELSPELVVLDIHLPDMGGIEVATRILGSSPATKILIFSGDAQPSVVDAALKLGVKGYILKSSGLDEIIRAIDTVLGGRLYFGNEVCLEILENHRRALLQPGEPAKPALPDRDIEILRLIAEGRRTKEIAVEMELSPKTVETYRLRLMKRLGYQSTAELVRYAIREGIVVA